MIRFFPTIFLMVLAACATDTEVFRNVDGSMRDASDVGSEGEPAPPGFCEFGDVAWSFCEDFDGLGTSGAQSFDHERGLVWSSHDANREGYRPDCQSTLTDQSVSAAQRTCDPFYRSGELVQNAETGGYAFSHVRIAQPFDFGGREGRVHVSLNMTRLAGRKWAGVFITPLLTNTFPDVRGAAGSVGTYHAVPGLLIRFSQPDGLQPFSASYWNDGIGVDLFAGFGPLELAERTGIDIILTRTSVRILVDGQEEVRETFSDIGFDRAYVYFVNIAPEPRKADLLGAVANRTLWDNLAFDGPVLAPNALIPSGQREALFSAFASAGCTVAGRQATGPVEPANLWQTWHVQLPLTDPAPTIDSVRCTLNPSFVRPIEDFRVVTGP